MAQKFASLFKTAETPPRQENRDFMEILSAKLATKLSKTSLNVPLKPQPGLAHPRGSPDDFASDDDKAVDLSSENNQNYLDGTPVDNHVTLG